MEFQLKRGVVIAIPTLVAIFWVPLSECSIFLWALSIILIGGDSVTTSLFPLFDEEEQSGYTRYLCGAQPSLRCMLFTRLPIIGSAAILYFGWVRSEFVVSVGSVTLPPELIPPYFLL